MLSISRNCGILLAIFFLFHFQETHAIMCYDCNSEFDPRCADPFDPYSIGQVNCSKKAHPEHLKDKYEPVLCRKTTQKVYGKVRVVRGCGYIRDSKDDKECVKRSGTHDVQAIYCACTTDLCNGAERAFGKESLLLFLLPIFFFFCNF
uniref:Uncharacterized protein n=1 Tax=Megaselia scalaris TaxID=36166 RepID=T1GQL7_MEGSC